MANMYSVITSYSIHYTKLYDAWFSVYQPGTGWLDFDPTNNQVPREQHITLAWGRDFADVTPLKGVAYGGGEHDLKVAVDVLAIP